MLNSLETAQLSRHPERSDSALVAFLQRYEGENFLATAFEMRKQLGELELGWYAGDGKAVVEHVVKDGNDIDIEEVKIKIMAEPEAKEEVATDMDTYDDDMDRWT